MLFHKQPLEQFSMKIFFQALSIKAVQDLGQGTLLPYMKILLKFKIQKIKEFH